MLKYILPGMKKEKIINSSLVKSEKLNKKELIGKALYELIEVFKEISLNEKQ